MALFSHLPCFAALGGRLFDNGKMHKDLYLLEVIQVILILLIAKQMAQFSSSKLHAFFGLLK